MQYIAKNMIPGPIEIVRGKGIKVYDQEGREYLDLTSQTLCLNLGHGHPVILDAVRELLNADGFTYYVSPRFKNRKVAELAEKLVELAPKGLNKVNLHLCNGSDATEDGLKRARKYHRDNGKKKIVSLKGSYLGASSETISASGGNIWQEPCLGGSGDYIYIDPIEPYRKPAGMTLEDYTKAKISEFENLVKRRNDIAGIIMEIVPFNAGILVPPRDYMKGIEKVCNENDIAMIVDEIQTGFGWCGDILASNIYKIRPDIIALAKGMTSGFPALAATVFKEKYDVLNPGTSEYTFGAQTLGSAVALANINYLTTSGILDTIPEKHERFMSHLKRMKEKYPFVGDVRGLGLLLGVEFIHEDGSPDKEIGIDVFHACIERRLFINIPTTFPGYHSAISIKPPIIITPKEIDESMGRLDEALQSCMR
ncbi:MAG: aspartate aminotransferase family protein [Nanoarchaeota archaeon]|nr:aspartate aminotransferase family protein [Nanoarchaeota archaeon]